MTDPEASKRLVRLISKVGQLEDAEALEHALQAMEDRAALCEMVGGCVGDVGTESDMDRYYAARRHMGGER